MAIGNDGAMTVASDTVVRSAPRPGIVQLTFNRPDKKNALSIALRDAVSDALDDLAAADDIANAFLFLASDEASYITGQNLMVCGGVTAYVYNVPKE